MKFLLLQFVFMPVSVLYSGHSWLCLCPPQHPTRHVRVVRMASVVDSRILELKAFANSVPGEGLEMAEGWGKCPRPV